MEKINMTCGRFQPFTKGHLNMVDEGDAPCIVYRINSSGKIPETIKGWKVGGRVVRPESIKKVINYIDTQEGDLTDLTEQEKELLKRPFTNELIDEELEIIRKSNKNIIDVIPVINFFDALMKFNKFITDNADHYEPLYLMCGDDRAEAYTENIEKYDELEDDWQSGKKIPNVLKEKLKVNTGKGRTEGVSGTEVRKSILTNDKSKFESIMPKGVGSMFDKFVDAFNDFKDKLQGLIKENHSFTNYINNNMKDIKQFILEGKAPNKISATGKKKLTKYIDDLIKHIDDIFDYAGIPTDDGDQVDSDCRDTVWNWVHDNGVCNWDTEDDESSKFINSEYERLAQAICNKYNL